MLNLQEFSDLMAPTVREQFPCFAGFGTRAVSLDRLREMSHMIVRDPTGLLRQETPTAQVAPAPVVLPNPAVAAQNVRAFMNA